MHDILARLDQMALDQKARDEGLRQAFRILTDAMKRMQAVVEDIHAAATKELPPSKVPALLSELKEILEKQPALIAEAVRDVLKP